MKHSDLIKTPLAEAQGFGPKQEPTFDPNASIDTAQPEPNAGTQPSRVGPLAKGSNAISQGVRKGLNWFSSAARDARAGKQQATRVANVFINQWRQATAQDPRLNTPANLMAFAEKFAPDLADQGDTIYTPTDMSPAGAAKYITDIVSKDLAATTVYGDNRTSRDPISDRARQQAEYELAVEKWRKGLGAKPNPVDIAQAFTKKNMSIGGEKLDPEDPLTQKIMNQLNQQGAELHNLEDEVDQIATQINKQPTAESRNFSAALWKQVRNT
jgi:hypothetical protein